MSFFSPSGGIEASIEASVYPGSNSPSPKSLRGAVATWDACVLVVLVHLAL